MRLFADDIDDDAPAVLDGRETRTYGELRALVAAAADHLRRSGVDASSRVAIAGGGALDGHSLENWVAHLAVMGIGATHASVTSGKALVKLARTNEINALIGPPLLADALPDGLLHIPFSLDGLAPARSAVPVGMDSWPARINMSSGTTGRAKVIEWDSAMIEARLDQVGQHLSSGSRVLTLLKIGTTAGFRYPLATWRAGGAVIFRRKDDEDAAFEATKKANLLICSPHHLAQRLAREAGEWPGRDERTIAVLGARLPIDVRDEALKRAAAKVMISYGSTEGGNVAFGDSLHADRHPGAVGFVRDDVELQIIDGQGRERPPGQRGLIRTRGAAICATAYSSGVDDQPWFYPGDLGVRFADGLLAIEGRASETINVGGNKHNAADLEARLANLPRVRELCLCVVPLPGRDQATVAMVCEPGANLAELHRMIDERMPFRDFGVVVLPKLPRNAMGKIPRASLAKALAATIENEDLQVRHA